MLKNGVRKKILLGMAIIVIVGNITSCGRQVMASLKVDSVENLEITYRDSIVRRLIKNN